MGTLPPNLVHPIRIAVMLVLLGSVQVPLRAMRPALDGSSLPPLYAWVGLVVLVLAFLALALLGRSSPPGVRLVEVALAAIFGLVPPWQWILWFGFGTVSRTLTGGFGTSMVPQMIALAWLLIAAVAMLSPARPTADHPAGA